MEREIVLDTETTGFDPFKGHRLVEIGCVELVNCLPTGRVFHCYLNPERAVPSDAFAVHGLSTEFLADFPVFQHRVEEFLAFIHQARLVIHNATFDMKFLNAELSWLGLPQLANHVTDTLLLARKKFPGSPASLDALCKRFGVNLKAREKHGALLDAQLLAQIYLELRGGRQPTLSFAPKATTTQEGKDSTEPENLKAPKPVRPLRSFPISAEQAQQHRTLMEELKAPSWQLPLGSVVSSEINFEAAAASRVSTRKKTSAS